MLAGCMGFCSVACLASPLQQLMPLSLESAVEIAASRNPNTEAYAARATAFKHSAEAAMQLPAPTMRTGFMNVPMDSLALNAEPMTQSILGVRQAIPPRGVRAAQRLHQMEQAQAMEHLVAAELKQTIYDIRVAWLSVQAYQHELELTSSARELLISLKQIVRARYAAGDELQLAVLAAELEENRLQNRLLDTHRLERNAMAELQRLLDISEDLTIDHILPQWDEVPEHRKVGSALEQHPRMQAARALIAAETAVVELMLTQFNPAWQVDLSYGLRSGDHLNGQARSDFASATVSVSLPWFAKEQNQRRVDAARAKEEAALQTSQALLRDMRAELNKAYEDWHALSERLVLLVDTIVPQTQSHAQATLQAYQNKEGSYADVLLSYVDEVDTGLEMHQLKVDRLKAWAKIDALNGLSQ